MKKPQIKVAETTYKGQKVTVFIDHHGGDKYELSAYTKAGRLNQLPMMETIILAALYDRCIELEDYKSVTKSRTNRFAGLMEGEDDET